MNEFADRWKLLMEENFHFTVTKIKKNKESTDGNVYMIETEEKKYVAKIYPTLQHTHTMIKLYRALEKEKVIVPHIIKNKGGEGYTEIPNYGYMDLYTFMQGKAIKWKQREVDLNKTEITNLAKVIRKLHHISNNTEIALPTVGFATRTNRQSVLHFDLTKENILRNGQTFQLIDFDDAKYGDSACDIAILIINLFFSKTYGIDKRGIDQFISSYYGSDSELKNLEKPLLKYYAINWINHIMTGNEFKSSTVDSLVKKRDLAQKYWE